MQSRVAWDDVFAVVSSFQEVCKSCEDDEKAVVARIESELDAYRHVSHFELLPLPNWIGSTWIEPIPIPEPPLDGFTRRVQIGFYMSLSRLKLCVYMLTPGLAKALEFAKTLSELSLKSEGCPPDWYCEYSLRSRNELWRLMKTRPGALALHHLLMCSTSIIQLEMYGSMPMAFVVAVCRALLAGLRRKAPLTRLIDNDCLTSLNYVLTDKREEETGVKQSNFAPPLNLVCRALRTDCRLRYVEIRPNSECQLWARPMMFSQRKHFLDALWCNPAQRAVTICYGSPDSFEHDDFMDAKRTVVFSSCTDQDERNEIERLPKISQIVLPFGTECKEVQRMQSTHPNSTILVIQ